MSKQEFIQNVRTARNLLVHHVESTDPNLHSNDAERRLSRAAIWLTPASVRGFDSGDFPELSEIARGELDRNVRRFRDVATQVPPEGPSTAEQRRVGLEAFQRILGILDPYMPTSDETRRLREAMQEVTFPDQVLTWEFEFGRDSSNDPAVWIWLVVEDAAADDPAFAAATARLPRRIRDALQKAGLDRWPYVRFRTASEQKALQAVDA